jgi:hypothetical protein
MCSACLADDDTLKADVIKAFPNGKKDDIDLYVLQAKGYINPEYAACHLLRALEGTKQGGNLWMTGNGETITSIGFERCPVEPNIWRKTIEDKTILIAIYVDDIVVRYPKGSRLLVYKHFL